MRQDLKEMRPAATSQHNNNNNRISFIHDNYELAEL